MKEDVILRILGIGTSLSYHINEENREDVRDSTKFPLKMLKI